jgi:hypothetical protein
MGPLAILKKKNNSSDSFKIALSNQYELYNKKRMD